MTRRVLVLLAPYVLLLLILAPSLSAAALPSQLVPTSCAGTGGCHSICDIVTLAQNVLNAAIFFAVVNSAVLFAWAGWKYVSAGQNSEQINSAKEVFFNVIVGLVIILASWLVVDTLIRTLTTLGSGWAKLC